MLISWIQKTTLLDYPGKVATLIFTLWCNLRCKYCHNSEFVLPEKVKEFKDFIPEEIFFNFLKTKVWILDGVVICWWEPTLQKDLFSFCKKIKELWFLVKLDTNWQNPEILKKLLNEKLVDYIAMDIKWDYDDLSDLLWVNYEKEKYLEIIEIIKKSNIDYEFRTTLIKNYHFLKDFEKVVKQIAWSKKYFLQNFRKWNILDKTFTWESFSEKELFEFREIAWKYVEKVIIRI